MKQFATITLFVLGLVFCGQAAAASGGIVNARIHTLAEETVEAMAWNEQGRIVHLGDAASLAEAYPDLEPRDLDGRIVLPGLIDAHGHVMGLGLARLQADLVGADSIEEVLSRLEAHAEDLPDGAWLTGRGWDQTRWEGRAFPSAADLDEAFPDRPVYLVRIDGHAAWVNSAALEHATEDLSGDWQPQGGNIHRADDGQPTGILIDTAMPYVAEAMPEPSGEERELALDLALAEIARYGLTGVHDAGTSLADFMQFRRRDEAGDLTVRIHALADGDADMLKWLCDNGPHAGNRLNARAVKLYTDGALGSRGAALLTDYSDEPGNRGLLFHSDEALQALVDRVMGCGLQLGIHAIGDAANRQVIDALAAVADNHPDNPGRHRIEHVQIIAVDDITRMAEHDIIASMQPIHATSDMRWAEDRVGSERLAGAYAWQRVLDAEVHLALGSDFPVEPVNPWLGIHAAVTRQDLDGNPDGGWLPDQRLSVNEALHGFTRDAAWAGFAEADTGLLEVGKYADFIVVDADPWDVDPAALAEISVLETVVGGQQVYRKDSP
jgi:predicted amidohydrolase YtcJ